MSRTTDHGYDSKHRARRKREQRNVDAGNAYCWRCGELIPPDSDWDLGHDDNDRTKYMGPEHVACNRATKGHRTTIIVDNSREW